MTPMKQLQQLNAMYSKRARFEEGKPVDVPEYLRDHGNPEAAKEWEEMTEEHKDNFKKADEFDDYGLDSFDPLEDEDGDEPLEDDIFASDDDDIFAESDNPFDNLAKTAKVIPGLYGTPRGLQALCERAIKRLSKSAGATAKSISATAGMRTFLKAHADRTDSLPAKILLAAMGESKDEDVVRKANQPLGLYGFPQKIANAALLACANLQEQAGTYAVALHQRKASKHKEITSFFTSHAKQGKCLYSRLLGRAYPESERV